MTYFPSLEAEILLFYYNNQHGKQIHSHPQKIWIQTALMSDEVGKPAPQKKLTYVPFIIKAWRHHEKALYFMDFLLKRDVVVGQKCSEGSYTGVNEQDRIG